MHERQFHHLQTASISADSWSYCCVSNGLRAICHPQHLTHPLTLHPSTGLTAGVGVCRVWWIPLQSVGELEAVFYYPIWEHRDFPHTPAECSKPMQCIRAGLFSKIFHRCVEYRGNWMIVYRLVVSDWQFRILKQYFHLSAHDRLLQEERLRVFNLFLLSCLCIFI